MNWLNWDWFGGFWLGEGCISYVTKIKAWRLTVSQKNERLIDELKEWLITEGFHPYKQRCSVVGAFQLVIYRYQEVIDIAKKLLPYIPSWHIKTTKLNSAINIMQARLDNNRSHIENGERDILGRFTCGHTYHKHSLEGKTDEFKHLYLDPSITIESMPKILGVGRTTVYREIKRLGLPLKSQLLLNL